MTLPQWRRAKATATHLLLTSAAAFTLGVSTLRAQSALDSFDPNANAAVRVVVVQPDGKVLLGGDFTTLSVNGGVAVTRNHIARLNPDGTLDSTFNPNANGSVFAIAIQADGKILVGGNFSGANSIGGQSRNRIARLEATAGSADAFDPNANIDVYAVAVQADGKILVGGDFVTIGGTNRSSIARLDPTTGLADAFDPNANSRVRSIVVQADGKILAGGEFSGANSIGGQTRNYIARLDPATGLADTFDPNANGIIRSMVLQADGRIIAGGEFSGANAIGGQTRNRIARLDPTTGAADSFNPNSTGIVYALAVQADGKVLAGGQFFGANSIGGQTRNRIARLDPATGLADSFDPNANNIVFALAVEPDGKLVAGGSFTSLSPNGGAAFARNRIARLETDGSIYFALNPSIAGTQVETAVVQTDGKIVIGGTFTTVLGVTRNNIARLNADGTLDTAFNPNANGSVYALAVQSDGKILVGGDFNGANSIGGQTRNYIARLDPVTGAADSFNPNANSIVSVLAVQSDGRILVGGFFISIGGAARNYIARLDTTGFADSFDPNSNGFVFAIAVQPDGKILVGGYFSGPLSIGGQARNYIARLDTTTGLADSFNPNANDVVHAIGVQADGKVLAAGAFKGTNSIGGQARNYIARLNATTGVADSFNPNATNTVTAIALQSDGKILVGGDFNGPNSIGGQTRNYIARLDPTTGLADSFDPNANTSVSAIVLQSDGKILVGGYFSGTNSIGGQTRNFFARLSNDTAALQNLAVTNSTIMWTRGGAGPQITRVTFELSANNVSYSLLGNGTLTGSNSTLAGLNLPIGQNFYIRARGFYRTGEFNSSESITESVRNAFIPTPPLLNIQRNGNSNVVLSWPSTFSGFTLESNTNLTTNFWSAVSPAPTVSGTNNVVTNAANFSPRFYRLRK